MTARELIEKLQSMGDLDRPLFIASDEEGNQYGDLNEFSFSSYDDVIIIYPGAQYGGIRQRR